MRETWVRSLGGGHGKPLQYSCLENPHGQRSLVGYSPWVCKESDMTEQLSTAQHRDSNTSSLTSLSWQSGEGMGSNIKWRTIWENSHTVYPHILKNGLFWIYQHIYNMEFIMLKKNYESLKILGSYHIWNIKLYKYLSFHPSNELCVWPIHCGPCWTKHPLWVWIFNLTFTNCEI